jgi:hypothetical protein
MNISLYMNLQLYIHDSFKKFWDRSEYSDIMAGKLEVACACCDMHASSTQHICSVAVRLADLILEKNAMHRRFRNGEMDSLK